ncbi:MerR family transcriptional regulator [Alphaproteobacteria bacterium]|nr:MerR family transcriptional regulator [Alphaproteobacteria bacterium]
MDKTKDAYKTIGEVSRELDVLPHVLRFWESKFDRLKLIKRKNNHRYYNKDDLFFLLKIKKLIHEEGYTIKGVQLYFKKNNVLIKKIYNKEEVYLELIHEIKKDISDIINH